jgi:O-acetyl-ADP-ribose deacetylase (regulator of RNase III)
VSSLDIVKLIGRTEIRLLQGDITHQRVDAIANAANAQLAGGGGVDGAIHRAGGPQIMQELQEWKRVNGQGCPTGSAVATGAGMLNARYVFHAVGPIWHGGSSGEPELLGSAYRSCLELAVAYNLRSIAFPSISTGVYGYPVDLAARVAIDTVAQFCRLNQSLREIRFVLFDGKTFQAFEYALNSVARE